MILKKLDRRIPSVFIASLIIIIGFWQLWPSHERKNSLNLSTSTANESLDIPIFSLGESSNLTKDSIREIRASYFDKIPGLLGARYALRESVFGNIKDDAPWISKPSYFFFGTENSIQGGQALEETGLINPLLLIYPDFKGWSIRGSLKWNRDLVLEQQALTQKNFPFSPEPVSFSLNPIKNEASVIYNLTEFQQSSQPWLLEPLQLSALSFLPVAYNAKDSGFDWYKLSSESININIPESSAPRLFQLFANRLAYSKSPDCGSVELGCNSRSLFSKEDIKVTALPAEAVFFLWRTAPSNPEQEPDMKFRIIMK